MNYEGNWRYEKLENSFLGNSIFDLSWLFKNALKSEMYGFLRLQKSKETGISQDMFFAELPKKQEHK